MHHQIITTSGYEQYYFHHINRIAKLAGLQPYAPEHIQSIAANPAQEAWVLIMPAISRHPAGYAVFQIVPPEGEIYDIAILPVLQGRHLGTMLLERVLQFFRYNEVDEVYLEVRESNRPAIQFYQRHGFQIRHVRKDYYTFPKEDALFLCRNLREACGPDSFLS